jgi:hypothetical protein
MLPSWWPSTYDGSGGNPKETPYPIAFPGTDMLNPDSNGDGIPDGISDQDHDGLSNEFELQRPWNWQSTYVSVGHNFDPSGPTITPGADPYARVDPFNPCKPVFSQTCHLHPNFGYYPPSEDWAFPRSMMGSIPAPGPTP